MVDTVVEKVLDVLRQADFATAEKEASCDVTGGGLNVSVLHHVKSIEGFLKEVNQVCPNSKTVCL